jgi:hypothetical protein
MAKQSARKTVQTREVIFFYIFDDASSSVFTSSHRMKRFNLWGVF